MTWKYAYTPQIWPPFLTVLLLIALGVYCLRKRSVSGALAFANGCLFATLWSIGSLLEFTAVDPATKIFWVKFQAVWQLPTVTALTCFILEYAWPGRWLTRRNLLLFSIGPLLVILVIATNNLHHLFWTGFEVNESVLPLRGPAAFFFIIYAYGFLGTINLIVFAWLFVHSPQHHWPVVIMYVGLTGALSIYILEKTYIVRFELPLDVLGLGFMFLIYTIALFGFRIFDPIPLARRTVIDQMGEGMIVLDNQGQVATSNPAAAAILRKPDKQLVNYPIRDLLNGYTSIGSDSIDAKANQLEICLGKGPEKRYYLVERSLLQDFRGLEIGQLVLLHEITGQKQAQEQLLEQQRALAMFSEREKLARELHDGIGQVLGYAKVQAQEARDLLAQDQIAAADKDLEKLITVTQEAHTEVREYILGAKITDSDQPGFLPMLQRYLQRFSEHNTLRTELIAPQIGTDFALEPTVEAQLLRIIQEALTSVRKYAQAQCVLVQIHLNGEHAQVIIKGDGVGFGSMFLANEDGQKYSLAFMRERAEEVGGSVEIKSAPGQGTQVVVEVPLKKDTGIRRSGLVYGDLS